MGIRVITFLCAYFLNGDICTCDFFVLDVSPMVIEGDTSMSMLQSRLDRYAAR